jgi:hypothetical protein
MERPKLLEILEIMEQVMNKRSSQIWRRRHLLTLDIANR